MKTNRKKSDHWDVSVNSDAPEIEKDVQAIHHLVSNLKEILHTDSDPIVGSLRSLTIQNKNTKFIGSIRFQKYFKKHVIPLLPARAKTWEKVRLITDRKRQNKIQSIFQRWSMLALETLLEKKLIRKKADELYFKYMLSWQRQIMKSWLIVSLGPFSRKRVLSKRRARMQQTRSHLQEKLMTLNDAKSDKCIIPVQIIHSEMIKATINEMLIARSKRIILMCFVTWKCVNQNVKCSLDNAKKHYRKYHLQLIFTAWSKWAFLVAMGLDYAIWKRKPRRYKRTRYNQILVDIFAERRVLSVTFQNWAKLSKAYSRARDMFIKKSSNSVRVSLYKWKKVTKKNRQMVSYALSRWIKYNTDILKLVFVPWQKWAHSRILHKKMQKILLDSYHRCQNRRCAYRLFKKWRHQAKYGRINAFYSRNEMMESLLAQKDHCWKMEIELNSCIDKVRELSESIDINEGQIKQLQDNLRAKNIELNQQKLSLHNSEQEIARLQSTVDCVCKIQPTLTKHILEMQPKFGFQDNNLEQFARLRARVTYENSGNLERMNWAMSRSKLRIIATNIKDKDTNKEELLLDEVRRLSSLFEFVRSGDQSLLLDGDKESWNKCSLGKDKEASLTRSNIASRSKKDRQTHLRSSAIIIDKTDFCPSVIMESELRWQDFNLILNQKIPNHLVRGDSSMEKRIQMNFKKHIEMQENCKNHRKIKKTNLYLAVNDFINDKRFELDDYSTSSEEDNNEDDTINLWNLT